MDDEGAWLAASADGVLVNAVIGEKKPGDYIDEAIVLAHERLREAGFFRHDVHMASTLLWDMRYAGPKEAVFHALVRKNLLYPPYVWPRPRWRGELL